MPHQNSVFHGILKHVPWAEFDRLVDRHKADARVRQLTTKGQFVAMLYGQLSGASSLRQLVSELASHEGRLYHLGARAARRSTLSDANAPRPSEVFSALFAQMVKQVHRGLRRKIGETTYLIDSTGVRLNSFSNWARFSAGVCGAKMHVIYDPARQSHAPPADRPPTPERPGTAAQYSSNGSSMEMSAEPDSRGSSPGMTKESESERIDRAVVLIPPLDGEGGALPKRAGWGDSVRWVLPPSQRRQGDAGPPR